MRKEFLDEYVYLLEECKDVVDLQDLNNKMTILYNQRFYEIRDEDRKSLKVGDLVIIKDEYIKKQPEKIGAEFVIIKKSKRFISISPFGAVESDEIIKCDAGCLQKV